MIAPLPCVCADLAFRYALRSASWHQGPLTKALVPEYDAWMPLMVLRAFKIGAIAANLDRSELVRARYRWRLALLRKLWVWATKKGA